MKPKTVFIFSIKVLLVAYLAPINPADGKRIHPDPSMLADMRISNTHIISASSVPATKVLPEYIGVVGYIRPAIHFEVRMPTSKWNGKFHMAGCGGFCGSLERPANSARTFNAINYALKRNYAVACTDSGHWGSSVLDGTWAYYNRQAEIDWGYRSIHEVTAVAKTLIEAYYGKPPSYSYFVGCSTGGRQAVMEALKYPRDFNGIVSGAPALDYTGLVATFLSWVVQANRDQDGKAILDHTKLQMITDAVYAACDSKDGLVDGLIDDPRNCDFNPQSLLCQTEATENCLTASQIEVLNKFYNGAENSTGKKLYPGIPIGSETFWSLWVTGSGKGPGLVEIFNNNFLKYMAFETDPDSSWDPYNFNFDTDPAKLDFMANIYNATNSDLSQFKEVGGKLIMYHGWSDSIVPPFYTVEYFEKVMEKMGGLQRTQEFFRLFMIPGMDHCGVLPGKGPDQADFLTALEIWVEKGQAPDQIIAEQKTKEGKLVRARPLCPYPMMVTYKGSQNPDEATSFSCK